MISRSNSSHEGRCIDFPSGQFKHGFAQMGDEPLIHLNRWGISKEEGVSHNDSATTSVAVNATHRPASRNVPVLIDYFPRVRVPNWFVASLVKREDGENPSRTRRCNRG